MALRLKGGWRALIFSNLVMRCFWVVNRRHRKSLWPRLLSFLLHWVMLGDCSKINLWICIVLALRFCKIWWIFYYQRQLSHFFYSSINIFFSLFWSILSRYFSLSCYGWLLVDFLRFFKYFDVLLVNGFQTLQVMRIIYSVILILVWSLDVITIS